MQRLKKLKDTHNLCEWYPAEDEPASYVKLNTNFAINEVWVLYSGCLREAELSLGDGEWHVCRHCAEREAFKKYKKRVELKK